MKNEELAYIIWDMTREVMERRNSQGTKKEQILPETKTIELFPTKDFQDEEANRFGSCIYDVIDFIRDYYGITIKIDYEPRTEFELFPEAQHVSEYLYLKATNKK